MTAVKSAPSSSTTPTSTSTSPSSSPLIVEMLLLATELTKLGHELAKSIPSVSVKGLQPSQTEVPATKPLKASSLLQIINNALPSLVEGVSSDSSNTSDSDACHRAAVRLGKKKATQKKPKKLKLQVAPDKVGDLKIGSPAITAAAVVTEGQRHPRGEELNGACLSEEPPKKQKKQDTVVVSKSPVSPISPSAENGSGKATSITTSRYQRIDVTKVKFSKDELKNNDIKLTDGDFAEKAFDKVSGFKGKQFRKQKTKGKRATYSCGMLTAQSRSVKFDEDSD